MSKTISTVKGDIFSFLKPGDIMVHGCNAQGVMGSGIAATVRALYPGAYDAYRKAEETTGLIMGDVIPYFDVNDRITIANAITQEFFGRDPKVRYMSYDAIDDAFKKLRLATEISRYERLFFPMIGAGLGNGKWPVIQEIIRGAFEGSEIPLIYVEYQR